MSHIFFVFLPKDFLLSFINFYSVFGIPLGLTCFVYIQVVMQRGRGRGRGAGHGNRDGQGNRGRGRGNNLNRSSSSQNLNDGGSSSEGNWTCNKCGKTNYPSRNRTGCFYCHNDPNDPNNNSSQVRVKHESSQRKAFISYSF